MTMNMTTLNTLKKLAGTFAFAAAALAAPLAARAASGDITAIFPVDATGARLDAPVSTTDSPLQSGDVIRFAVRLAKRTGTTDTAWSLVHVGLGSEVLDAQASPFAIGLYVAGDDVPRYATYDGKIDASGYTDIFFRYEVRPGDFALPAILAVNQDSPCPANKAQYCDMGYHVSPAGLACWEIQSQAASASTPYTASLLFKTSADVTNQDYDLRTAGFYVKTVDFDEATATALNAWRSVPAGTTAQGTIHVESMPTNSMTLYVWSEDESIVKVNGSLTRQVHVTAGITETRSVALIKVIAGQQDYNFRFTGGAAAAGSATTLYLSACDDFNYQYVSNDRYVDYLTATVAVTEAPDPYISLTDATGKSSAKVVATSNVTDYTEMRLVFSQAFTEDVTVTLKQKIDGTDVEAADNYVDNRYLAILTDPEANPISTTSVQTLTMPKGETELKFYLFGLGTTNSLASPGLTLVPDLSAATSAAQAFFATGDHKSVLVKMTDQAPTVEVSAPSTAYQSDTVSVDVTVSDNWRDLQTGENNWNEAGYKVAISFDGTTAVETNGVAFTEDGTVSFSVKVPVEGKPVTGLVKVWDLTHAKASEATFSMNVEAARAASATFYENSSLTNAYGSAHFFKEGDKPYFCVTLTSDAPQDMYAFLVPQNEAASNLVSCAAYTNGLFISSGSRVSEVATITFLDGFRSDDPMRAKFSVDLRTRQDYAAEDGKSFSDTYVMRSATLSCTNVSPALVNGSMQLNDTYVNNGATLESRVPAGANARFTARISDPSSVDLKATGDSAIQTMWKFTDGDADNRTTVTKYATCEDGVVSCAYSFEYENTTQTVTVYARDKDDLAERGDLDWGEPKYTFTVNVGSQPSVVFCGKDNALVETYSFDETCEDGRNNIYLRLTDRPNNGKPPITSTNPLRVNLEWSRKTTRGYLELVTNQVVFVNATSDTRAQAVEIDLPSLNGATESGTRYVLKATVITDDSTNAYDQKWCDYYSPGEVEVYVQNVAPTIAEVSRSDGTWIEAGSGTNTCAAGEIFTIDWRVTDVLPDLTNGKFTVSWNVNPTLASPTQKTTKIPADGLDDFNPEEEGRVTAISGQFVFAASTSAGSYPVKMTVSDGDGGTVEKEWILEVAASKDLRLNVFGPAGTAQSKYNAAKGRGQGFVAAEGNPSTKVSQFIRTFSYAESMNTATIYAWGYPSKETWDDYVTSASSLYGKYIDNGLNLLTALDLTELSGQALSKNGNTWAAGAYYDWSTRGGKDATAGNYDSYFYRWMVTKEASNGKGSSGSTTGGSDATKNDARPTYEPLATTTKTFDLDTGSENGNYGTVEAEAIFSRELYRLDNLGDINADGIPDKIVELYGIGASSVGETPENDLDDFSTFNDDEDYLPNSSTASSYSSLIPGLPGSWGDAQAFTAKLEVRGYGDGLNDGARLAGLSDHVLHPDYNSEDVEARKAARDYSDLEMAAWSLVDYDKDWSPERPSDPTKADTDSDGFPDGYEYYFWYRAHVGDPEYFKKTGTVRKLTGRRYDPKNPGDGTVITSEEIEKIMDPMVAYDGDAKTIDTDNDGLPDLLELLIGTNPFDFDTDGDGLPDGWEVMIANLDPLVTQSYAGELSDTLLNADGDAMAISSYKLEKTQLPVPVNYEHAKRLTFAVLDANGDTAGVQWYAMPTTAGGVSLTAGTEQEGYQLVASVDGADATFFSATEPSLTDAGLLKADLDVNTLVTYEGANAIGYPYTLRAGEKVTGVSAVTATPYTVTEEVAAAKANACWIYGKGAARTRIGEVAETAAEYGCLALARQKAVPSGATVVAFPNEDRDVAFLHYLCYQEFGFDPRTAWKAESPLHKRWGKVTNGEAEEGIYVVDRGGYTGTPARTRDYATYDEFLVSAFFHNNTTEGETLAYEATGISDQAPTLAKEWYALTTNPQGPMDDIAATSTNFYGRTSTNGADTDGDGVPDGWELYVMAGPKTQGGAYVFAPPYAGFSTAAMIGDDTGLGATIGDGTSSAPKMPKSYFSPFIASAKKNDTSNQIWVGGQDNSDGLNQFQEFEGTDTMLYYAAYSDTVVHDVENDGEWKWLNKFFPTDPWSPDTDGDGVKDADEKTAFAYVTSTYDDEAHGTLRVIPGGGLNPNSVDTDLDGLPDGWEKQFAGATVSPTNEADGYIDGMDGTVADAYTTPGGPNRDYDHDGLENWQEYLTGTMRCWRYDDPISPMTYWPKEMYGSTEEVNGVSVFKLDAAVAAQKFYDAGYLDAADEGEFWYKTLLDPSSPIYNPHLVMDRAPNAQYFSRVTNVWDSAYLDASLAGAKNPTGAYYWFYDRIDGTKLSDLWPAAWEKAGFTDASGYGVVPKKYASCSPIKADSDGDGMDDYYEVFHGLNPLLGDIGVAINAGASDIVYDSLSGGGSSTAPAAWPTVACPQNFWVRTVYSNGYEGKKPRGTGYDFEVFPWLNGLADADPDGDNVRNQEEAVMPLVGASAAWHHTDPTPLWMTDSSYTNSLVSMNYRLAHRGEQLLLASSDTFSYGGKTYALKEFDDFEQETALGAPITYVRPYSVDAWKVAGTALNTDGWIASFEENEGFDTDHDGIMDQDEVAGKYGSQTDPLDADSPRRRQAMYFQGPDRPSILQTMPFEPEVHPDASQHAGQYPDDLAFLEFTVECWVKAESLDDATVIERAILVSQSNPDDQEYVRRNFRLGLSGGKWVGSFDPNDTTTASVEVFSDNAATTDWTHLALTYDLNRLTLYVNGSVAGYKSSGLQPAYGRRYVATGQTGNVLTSAPAYQNHAFVVGASVKTFQSTDSESRASVGAALNVTNGVGWAAYEKFFTGYVDEIRVWDGARSATEIANAKSARFTSEDAASNRAEFYETWKTIGANGDRYRGRYAKDGSGNGYVLPAELRFHWAFDSLFGAASEGAVAKAPAGFNVGGMTDDEDGARARRSRPSGYGIAWWQNVLAGYTETVYDDPAWICWVQNTVAHLPRYDGTTLDSFYWSEDFKGDQSGTYTFARTAEPVSVWKQLVYGGVKPYENAFYAPGTRYHYMATNDVVTGSSFSTLYEFTGRHLNQRGDDMLALGGAFAKHVDAMWDDQGPSANWEISGVDDDGDGLPDWWEEYASGHYRINTEDDISWDTFVKWPDQDGTVMTAGEAYLRDLARGFHADDTGEHIVIDDSDGDFTQKADLDGNGIPDWWEELYGITGEAALDDHDNDGLPNIVEYILSEKFDIRDANGVRKVFDPTRANSGGTLETDYFFPIGSLYVGAVFSDHDFIEDWWERQYDTSYASSFVYDTKTDNDDDGWSTFAEARYSQQVSPIQANNKFHYDITSGAVQDHPVPAIQLTVKYNGARADDVSASSYGVRIGRDLSATKSAEAQYWIQGSKVINASQSGSETTGSTTSSAVSTSNEYKRVIGKWSNRHVLGTLTPGFVRANSIRLQTAYDPSSTIYSWRRYHVWYEDITKYSYTYHRGTKQEYLTALNKYGATNIELLSTTDSFSDLLGLTVGTDENSEVATLSFSGGKTLGTVNLKTGEYDFDLGIFAGGYVTDVNDTNDTTTVSLEDQTYRIVYSANPSTGTPRELYLGEADTGYVREGKNEIMVWADLNGDKEYTIGEPFGYVRDVDISWRKRAVEVEIRDQSPVMPRISLVDDSSNPVMDRGKSVTDYYQMLLDKINDLDITDESRTYMTNQLAWIYTNTWKSATIDTSSLEQTRVRIVRWVVDGQPIYRIGVDPDIVFDKKMYLANRAFLTEADIFSTGALDLDWDNLKTGVVDFKGVKMAGCPVTNVAYLVVIGDGRVKWNSETDTNSCPVVLDRVIERRYSLKQAAAEPFAPKSEGSVVYTAQPTFKWTIPGEDDSDYTGYTAFCVQVLDSTGATVVWDSGTRLLPPRDSNGRYVWTAPVYVGNELSPSVNYRWRVAVMNAKFPTPNWSSVGTGYFRMEPATVGSSYGSLKACVRYFGPTAEVLDRGTVLVEAFTSPDFSGDPAARAAVPAADKASVAAYGSNHVAQVTLSGLPVGKYYVRAYIDSVYGTPNVLDDWESWGYSCDRSGKTASMFAPLAWTIDKSTAGETCVIYIEDADTNGNRIPDAYEMYVNGGTLDNGTQKLDETLDCGLAVRKSLLGTNITEVTTSSADFSGLVAYYASALQTRAVAAMSIGVPASSITVDAATGALVVNPTVEDGTVAITDFAFDAAAGKVVLKVTADVASATAASSTIYAVTTGSTVMVKVLHTDTLAGDWTTVKTKTVKVTGDSLDTGLIEVDVSDVSATGGFYKVVVE